MFSIILCEQTIYRSFTSLELLAAFNGDTAKNGYFQRSSHLLFCYARLLRHSAYYPVSKGHHLIWHVLSAAIRLRLLLVHPVRFCVIYCSTPNRLIWQRRVLDRCRSLEEPCFCRDTLFYKNSRNCNGTSKLLFVRAPHLTQPEARTHSFCQNKHSETLLSLTFGAFICSH